jgi:predicted enzyme related to lactoylglutathione lyase
MSVNTFGDHELVSQDPPKAKAFYSALFGWKMNDQEVPGIGTRTEFQPASGQTGSIMPAFSPQQPSGWSIYVGVADLNATVARVGELGGRVIQSRIDVKGEGAFAVVADPTGAVFKLWERFH